MAVLSRRRFLQHLAALGLLPAVACQGRMPALLKAHVVIVGGGFGGATAASVLRQLDSGIKITLIEPNAKYITCPGSNWLFAGITTLAELTSDYRGLKARDIRIVTDRVEQIDKQHRRLKLAGGARLDYDRLILSPGISFRWDSIEGYDAAAAETFPHAWQAGPQTVLLRRQLQAMPAGGVVLIAAPANPYRCPPGPYERASMMAYWLRQHNPRAKIIILDHKRSFSKQALFEAAWRQYYGYGSGHSMIEWHSVADNAVVRLDERNKTLVTEFGDRFSADVLNIIPPQSAAAVAWDAGLTDSSGWCPVHPLDSQSVFDEFIHVIGDAATYAPIPKSAFAANSEAKACALAVMARLSGLNVHQPNWLNTCYSLAAPSHGISVSGIYKLDAEQSIAAVPGAGGISRHATPLDAEREAGYAKQAYAALVKDAFG